MFFFVPIHYDSIFIVFATCAHVCCLYLMLFWGPNVGVATIFGVVSVIATASTPIIVAVGDGVVVAATIVAITSAHVGATALDVVDAVNVEDVAMMVIDGEGCVQHFIDCTRSYRQI